MTLDLAAMTDPGCVRERNEDSIDIDRSLGLLVLADGMGGHNSGEVASQLAVETILSRAREVLAAGRAAEAVAALVREANAAIFEKSRAFPQDQGMGTTVVVALIDERRAVVAHVGDSRLYLLRGGALKALTEDHSLVADQLRSGLITKAQAETSSLQNILTRALGTEREVAVDVSEHGLGPGDRLLACSDGLTKMVSEPDISRTLAEASSAAQAAERLIRRAREAGGVDNITVGVARVPGAPAGGFFARFFGGGR